jgi:Family of unknown function (DUF6209)
VAIETGTGAVGVVPSMGLAPRRASVPDAVEVGPSGERNGQVGFGLVDDFSVAGDSASATGAALLGTPVRRSFAAPADALDGILPRPNRVGTAVYLGTGANRNLTSGAYLTQPVVAGREVRISTERTLQTSEVVKELRLHARVGGVLQPPLSIDPRSQPKSFALQLPPDANGELEFWFEGITASGASVWDSLDAQNFHLPIYPQPKALLAFDEQWNEQQTGTLEPGGTFELAYDVDRIRQFTGDLWYRMGPTLTVKAFVSFDGGPPQLHHLLSYHPETHEPAASMPTVAIPKDARSMRVWFEGRGIGISPRYDSDYSRDYRFSVQ